MGTFKFTDGMSFDTSGPLRIEHRSDGLYIVGKGMLMAIDTREEGERWITQENIKQAQAAAMRHVGVHETTPDCTITCLHPGDEGVGCELCGADLQHQTHCPSCGVFVGGHEA